MNENAEIFSKFCMKLANIGGDAEAVEEMIRITEEHCGPVNHDDFTAGWAAAHLAMLRNIGQNMLDSGAITVEELKRAATKAGFRVAVLPAPRG